MKISSKTISLTVCLLGLLMFPACLDIETTSRVNPDGSVLRTITFTDDSAGTYRGDFPIPLDSTWRQTTEKVGEDKFTVTASRLFRDVDEMNRTLKGTFGKTLQSEFALERTFQWFFTSYRFTERSLKYVQYDSIPLTDFVSAAEVESWERHEVEKKPFSTKGDSLAMMSAEKRGVEWEIRNVFEPIFATFLEGVGALRDPRLNRSFVESQKDTLYSASKESLELGNVDTLELIFAKTLRRPSARKAWQLKAAAFKDIKQKRNLNLVSGKLVSNVIMPGLITGSNAQTIEGNKATWRDYKDFARILGYTMWVESRQVNWWAVILTGVIVFLLAALLIASALKRRRIA